MIDTQMIVDYIALDETIDSTEETLKALKKNKEEMAKTINNMLATEGSRQVNVNGVTVAPRRVMRASASKDTGGVRGLAAALKAEGLDALVSETVNAQTLTGYVNGFDPDRMCSEDELRALLPEALRPHINLFEQLTLSLTRS